MTDLFGLDRYRDLFDLLFSPRTKEDPMTTRFRLKLRELGMTPDAVIEASRLLRMIGIEPCVVWTDVETGDQYTRPEDDAGVIRRVKDAALPVDRVVVAGDVIDVPLGPHARLTPCRVSAVSPFGSPTRWLVVDVPALIDGAELPEVRPGSHYLEVERGASWVLVSDVGTVRAPTLDVDDDEL